MRAAIPAAAVAALLLAAPAPAGAQQRTIVIDPGHGGADAGGTGTGLQEKNIVLDVAQRFRDLLELDDLDPSGGGQWKVLLTRDTDTYITLAGRSSYANAQGADRFLSIHANAFGDPSANGIETFSYQNGTQSAALRNLVQEEMVRAWGLRDRGNKTANFHVLRETSMPAVLHELAFITNATDAQKLASAQERQKAAVAHLIALQRHFGLDPHVPGLVVPPAAIAGWVSGPVGPVAGARVTLDGDRAADSGADGSFSFADLEAGAYLVAVEADGFEPALAEVTVEPAERAEIEIVLVPRARTEPDRSDDEPRGGGEVTGGCAAAGGSSAPAALLFLFLAARIRRPARDRSRSSDRARSRPCR